MKPLVVDSSSLISLSSNCLLWVIGKLREKFKVQLIITPGVRNEVITNALKIDKFRLSGVRILKLLGSGLLTVEADDSLFTKQVLSVANNIYFVKGNPYKIIHLGEVSLISVAKSNNYFKYRYLGPNSSLAQLLNHMIIRQR